jgi:hypothetical protein
MSNVKKVFRYNEKKVFHCDDDTKELITGTAHQLNGLSYIIDDVKEVLHYDLIYSFFEKRRLIKEVKKRINSSDWVIFNDKGFFPEVYIVEKEDFDANYYYGQIVKRNFFYYCDGITEDRIEDGDAIQITGERGNFEAIKFFLSTRRYSSRLNIKESKIKSEEFEHFIINGEEVKFKRYDYFVLAKTKERVKVIARKQFEV